MSLFKSVGKWFVGAGKKVKKETTDVVKTVSKSVETVGDVAGNAGDTVVDAAGNVGDAAMDVAENVGDTVVDVAGNVGGVVAGAAQKVGNFMGDRVEDVGELVEPVARPVANGIGNVVEDIKRFGQEVAKKGFELLVKQGEKSPLAQAAMQEINNHKKLVTTLSKTVEEFGRDKKLYAEVFEDIVKPISLGKIDGKEATRLIEGLAKHPALAELYEVAEEESGEDGGWCISLGVVLDIAGVMLGGQTAGGVALLPARTYGALSWSFGIAGGASFDAQIGVWFRKVDALPGKFQAIEIDLHMPHIELAGAPVGASITASFDTDTLMIMNSYNPEDHEGAITGFQGFVGSIGVGISAELFNRSAGNTWVTGT